jgi:hypothetical protein
VVDGRLQVDAVWVLIAALAIVHPDRLWSGRLVRIENLTVALQSANACESHRKSAQHMAVLTTVCLRRYIHIRRGPFSVPAYYSRQALGKDASM